MGQEITRYAISDVEQEYSLQLETELQGVFIATLAMDDGRIVSKKVFLH